VRKGTKANKAHKRKKTANVRLQQISRVAANLFFEKGFWQKEGTSNIEILCMDICYPGATTE